MSSSIVNGSGLHLLDWPSSGAIPTSYSAGGWTYGSEGFSQQTFLGASVKSFSMRGGFGAGSSSLSVSLVEDKYNQSDSAGYGLGDDVYHNGARDGFAPPVVGSPVFFKFGKTMATVTDAYTSTLDLYYGQRIGKPYSSYSTPVAFGPADEFSSGQDGQIDARPPAGNVAPYDTAYFSGVKGGTGFSGSGNNIWINEYRKIYGADRGRDHLVFGGILQNTNESKSTGGAPAYTANIVDPREILSNVTVILKDYAGSNYGQHNMLNVFGFLEYDPSDSLKLDLESGATKTLLTKVVKPDGSVVFTDTEGKGVADVYVENYSRPMSFDRRPPVFPVTGEGMSRRSDKGIPFYRILQGIDALLEYDGKLPDEYKHAFGTQINFRGFKYVVDFAGLPTKLIPSMYTVDFAQTDLLSLVQEVCDVVSQDLFVTLLPVINHPYCEFLYEYNQNKIYNDQSGDIVAGIIRIDCIDRSEEPEYGAVRTYLDTLIAAGVEVTNQDLGYEITNNPVDKFVVGAQEVKMHYFETTKDRDFNELRKKELGLTNRQAKKTAWQWSLEASLEQQVLPFYGFLGKDAVTIPRGWGAYQQILLDAQGLAAHGVDNYYVATEMEMRAALVSFERWKEFLLLYSEVYMESLEEDDFAQAALLNTVTFSDDAFSQAMASGIGTKVKDGISKNYSVTVPRCVFKSDKDYINAEGLPASACSPPFGYPLYYKRAQRIGIAEAGVAKIASQIKQIFTDYATLKARLKKEGNEIEEIQSEWSNLTDELLAAGNTEEQIASWESAQNLLSHMHLLNDELDKRGEKVVEPFTINESESVGGGGVNDAGKVADNKLGDPKATMERIRNQIAVIEAAIERNCKAIKSVSRLGEKTLENAMKVYSFVKGVAEKHLGKTFLIKIPKETNTKYSTEITVERWGEVVSGPFGFKPEPVHNDPNYFFTSKFQSYIQNLAQRQIPYRYGALKTNYDPISDRWVYNYKPRNAGGYFDFHINPQTVLPHQLFGGATPSHKKNKQSAAAAVGKQMFLPPAVKSYLFPVDGTNFVSDNGRIAPYVRFDNSQFLNFKGVPKDQMLQQVVTSNGQLVPDIVHTLDNMDEDKHHSFDTSALLRKLPKTIAYVKVKVDEKLYMAPKVVETDTVIFGRYVEDIGQMTKPRKIWNRDTCKYEYTVAYYQPHWVPHITTGGAGPTDQSEAIPKRDRGEPQLSVKWSDFYRSPVYSALQVGDNQKFIGNIVQTDLYNLDSDHVYAIITLPGRITPTIDSRCKDGPYQAFQAPTTKHYLTMDTVKIPQFKKPEWKSNVLVNIAGLCASASLGTAQNAFKAYKVAMEKLSIATPEARIHFTAPSPVYPDMVAMPLESTERCYGPWVSSFINDASYSYLDSNPRTARYANLGGKVEFTKDENLAPWNFGGYGLLDEAGSLKAAFSNSLQLFSERGGFSYVGIPAGNSLGKVLTNGGPLVTDISVDVGAGGVKTTYKMDLYTPRFGKLRKQHEVLIGQITRERQRLRDQRNLLIKNHLIQEHSSTEYTQEFAKFADLTQVIESDYSALQKSTTYSDMLIGQVQSETATEVTLGGEERIYTRTGHDISAMPNKIYTEALQMFPDRAARDKAYYDSAGGSLSDMFSPSSEAKHPNMTHENEVYRTQKKDEFYKQQNTGFE